MAETKQKEELQDEEPMKIGSGFVVKVLLIAAGLVTLIVGIPYLIMTK